MDNRARRSRISDVARVAGVSKTTVSFAFNSPSRLSPDTVERIQQVAAELGYRPHPVARMLAQRQTLTLGVLSAQALSVAFSNPFFASFSEGVAEAAEQGGYGLLFVSPVHGSLVRAMARASVDGMVALGLGEDHPEVEQVRRVGLPLVLVDSSTFPEHSSIEVDDETGAHLAASHLLDLGHREFLVIGVEPPYVADGWRATASGPGMVSTNRLQGYRQAMAERGIDLDDSRIVVGPATFGGGAEALEAAWRRGLKFTGVLSMSDAMAVGALYAARRHGVSVPGDLSVVGFDDIEIAQYTDPTLTTVHQPIREKGVDAASLLIASMSRRDGSPPEHRRMKTHLVVRGSSGPAPQRLEEVPSAE